MSSGNIRVHPLHPTQISTCHVQLTGIHVISSHSAHWWHHYADCLSLFASVSIASFWRSARFSLLFRPHPVKWSIAEVRGGIHGKDAVGISEKISIFMSSFPFPCHLLQLSTLKILLFINPHVSSPSRRETVLLHVLSRCPKEFTTSPISALRFTKVIKNNKNHFVRKSFYLHFAV